MNALPVVYVLVIPKQQEHRFVPSGYRAPDAEGDMTEAEMCWQMVVEPPVEAAKAEAAKAEAEAEADTQVPHG